jgi:hypothetical protein
VKVQLTVQLLLTWVQLGAEEIIDDPTDLSNILVAALFRRQLGRPR